MKTKYVGLDLHQSTIALHVRGDDNQTVMESIIRTERDTLVNTMQGLNSEDEQLEVAFEESSLAHWAYETVEPHVDRVVVCNPYDLSRRGSKTDKKDAEKLSRYLRMGELNEVYHGDGLDRQLKEYVLGHKQTTQSLVRAKNRLKSVFMARNIETPSVSLYNAENRQAWVEKLSAKAYKVKARQLYKRIQLLEKQKQTLQEHMIQRASQNDGWEPIQSIPGFGDIRTSKVIGYIGTPHRFRTKRQLFRYSCLAVVHSNSSEYEPTDQGFRHKQTDLTKGLNKDGNSALKAIFRSAAKTAICHYAEVHEALKERCERKSQAKATLDIARRLASMCLTLWKRKQLYDVDKARWNRR
jgi:transposase